MWGTFRSKTCKIIVPGNASDKIPMSSIVMKFKIYSQFKFSCDVGHCRNSLMLNYNLLVLIFTTKMYRNWQQTISSTASIDHRSAVCVSNCFRHVSCIWPALRAGLLCCNFFGQPGSVSKFPPFLCVKLWVGWVGRGYTEISRYFPASWINWVTLVTKIKLLYSLRF